jgi:PAS domain S-box-containing protein
MISEQSNKTGEDHTEELKNLRMQILEATEAGFRRESVERDLAEALDRQRAILDTIPHMAWVKDKEGKFLAANEAFLKAHGTSRNALLGTTDFDYWPEELARSYLRDDIEVMRSGNVRRFEERVIHSNNGPVWLETIKSPIQNSMGIVIGTTGIARDITAEKRAEEERERLVTDLRRAQAQIKRLNSLLPICSSCKKIRDKQGRWQHIEEFIQDHSEVDFSHSICPHCANHRT